LDIKASNPTLLSNLLNTLNVDHPRLRYYLANREQVHYSLKCSVPDYVWGEDSPKSLINGAVNGAKQLWRLIQPYIEENDFIHDLIYELDNALDVVFETYTSVPFNRDSFSPKGSRMTNVLLTMETKLVFDVIEEMYSEGLVNTRNNAFQVGYAYDGIMIPKETDVVRCTEIANAVARRNGLEGIRFLLKPLQGVVNAIPVTDVQVRVPDLRGCTSNKILIRYPTGGGKTFQAIAFAMSQFRRILVIVHRQSLARDIKQKYPSFKSYRGNDMSYGGDLQIICLNSLHKLLEPAKYECVIADEISSLLRQSVEMKLSPITIDVFRVFMSRRTSHFIGMDALLTKQDYEFMNELAPMELVQPIAINLPTSSVFIYDDLDELRTKLMDTIKNGKKVAIAYSCRIEHVESLLIELGVRYLNVNRYTKHLSDIREWTDYQVVAYSPTMDAGVDASFYDGMGECIEHFDEVYGIFSAMNTTPASAVQMLGRVRNCAVYRVVVTGHSSQEVFEEEADFRNSIASRLNLIQRYDLRAYLNDDFEPELVFDFKYQLVWHVVRSRKRCASTEYMKWMKYLLIRNSWSVQHLGSEEGISTEEQELLRTYDQRGVVNEAREIACSRVISDDVADRYSANNDFTVDMNREFIAYRTMKAYGFDLNRDPPPECSGVFGDEEDMLLIRQYRDLLQLDQFEKLFPYDSLEYCKFDYVTTFMQNKRIYYRLRQIVEEYNGNSFTFPFMLHAKSFNEITTYVLKILEKIGFDDISATIETKNDLVRELPLKRMLRGKCPEKFLLEHAGIVVKKTDDGFHVSNTFASASVNDEYAFFIEGLPIAYAPPWPDNFTPIGVCHVRCDGCFKKMRLMYARKHACNTNYNMRFEMQNNVRVRICNQCNAVVTHQPGRHFKNHR
jgi:hypothetical protein